MSMDTDIDKTSKNSHESGGSAQAPPDNFDLSVMTTGRKPLPASTSSNLWLTTFTDMVALMLTFFVMTYAMSEPKMELWEELTSKKTQEEKQFLGDPAWQGSEDTISLNRAQWGSALDLDYLEALLSDRLSESKYASDLNLVRDNQNNQLVISLPEHLLFSGGSADVTPDGIAALEELAPVFSRLRNAIDVSGHADPEPVWRNEQIQSNWDLSLERAISVAGVLKNMGYNRPIDMLGQSDAQYALLSENMDEDFKKSLSRRVDILVQVDNGRRIERLGIDSKQ